MPRLSSQDSASDRGRARNPAPCPPQIETTPVARPPHPSHARHETLPAVYKLPTMQRTNHQAAHALLRSVPVGLLPLERRSRPRKRQGLKRHAERALLPRCRAPSLDPLAKLQRNSRRKRAPPPHHDPHRAPHVPHNHPALCSSPFATSKRKGANVTRKSGLALTSSLLPLHFVLGGRSRWVNGGNPREAL